MNLPNFICWYCNGMKFSNQKTGSTAIDYLYFNKFLFDRHFIINKLKRNYYYYLHALTKQKQSLFTIFFLLKKILKKKLHTVLLHTNTNTFP